MCACAHTQHSYVRGVKGQLCRVGSPVSPLCLCIICFSAAVLKASGGQKQAVKEFIVALGSRQMSPSWGVWGGGGSAASGRLGGGRRGKHRTNWKWGGPQTQRPRPRKGCNSPNSHQPGPGVQMPEPKGTSSFKPTQRDLGTELRVARWARQDVYPPSHLAGHKGQS